MGGIRKFLAEVIVELKKVSWPTRRELIDSTWLVIISSAILGGYIALTDFFLTIIIGRIIHWQ